MKQTMKTLLQNLHGESIAGSDPVNSGFTRNKIMGAVGVIIAFGVVVLIIIIVVVVVLAIRSKKRKQQYPPTPPPADHFYNPYQQDNFRR